jgi:hypothetical protein
MRKILSLSFILILGTGLVALPAGAVPAPAGAAGAPSAFAALWEAVLGVLDPPPASASTTGGCPQAPCESGPGMDPAG